MLLSFGVAAVLLVEAGARNARSEGSLVEIEIDDLSVLAQVPFAGGQRLQPAWVHRPVLATHWLQVKAEVRSAPPDRRVAPDGARPLVLADEAGAEGAGTRRDAPARAGFCWIVVTLLALPLVCFAVFGTQGCQKKAPCEGATAAGIASVTQVDVRTKAADCEEQAALLAEFTQDLTQLKRTVFVAALCHSSMSYSTCVIGAALLRIRHDPIFAPVDSFTEGAVVSVMFIAAAVGALCSFPVADWGGRRRAILTVAFMLFGGCIAMACARGILHLMAGRALAGLGVGLSSCVANMYIAEVSPSAVRGRLGAWAPIMGQVGIFMAFVLPCLCIPLGTWAWRVLLGFAALPSGLVFALRGRLPETPAWLVAQGRSDEAQAVLARLFPKVSEQALRVELRLLAAESGSPSGGPDGLASFVWEHARALRAALSLNVLQQITGINVIRYFGPQLMKIAGASETQALAGLTGITPVLIMVVFAFSAVVDLWGRRSVMIRGTLVTMVGLATMSAGFLLQARGRQGLAIAMPVFGMVWARWAYAFSLAPLPYVMTVELLPQGARAVGAGLIWMANWAINAVVCQSFPMLLDRLREPLGRDMALSALFFGHLVCTAAALGVAFAVLPETAGARLGRVQA